MAWAGREFKGHLVSNPQLWAGIPSSRWKTGLLKAPSKQALNSSSDGASTTSLDSTFQCLATLTADKSGMDVFTWPIHRNLDCKEGISSHNYRSLIFSMMEVQGISMSLRGICCYPAKNAGSQQYSSLHRTKQEKTYSTLHFPTQMWPLKPGISVLYLLKNLLLFGPKFRAPILVCLNKKLNWAHAQEFSAI